LEKQKGCIEKQKIFKNKITLAGSWWLMPVILATQEVEIRRIMV
jgi:hypothetical protein